MRKILFHHIPKTAGTSLVSRAMAHFGDRVHHGRYDDQVCDDAILDRRFDFYHGHFTRGFVLRFRHLVPDAMIFTFVRHPFARTLSQYYNWTDRLRVLRELDVVAATSGETEALNRLRAKFETKIFDMSLERFLRSNDADVLQASDNLQAQYMTVVEAARPDHERFHTAALDAVSFYDFIGVQELYEPCLRILEAKCDLPNGRLGGNARENEGSNGKAEGRYRVSRRELRLLERRNVYDLALYHACYALLLKQHGDWLPPSASDLDRTVPLPEVVEEVRGLQPAGDSDRVAPFAERLAC